MKNLKQKLFAIIDTETLGGANDNFCHAYHLGAVCINRKGELIDNFNAIILENLLMDSAYYGQYKKEYYRQLCKDENVIIAYTEKEALDYFQDWLDTNEITTICAYNSGFDFVKTIVNQIINQYEFIDILYAFKDTIAQTKGYKKYCDDHEYLTARGTPRMTAEIAYRYVSGDDDFTEEHTALSDAEIESVILMAVWRTHRKFTRNQHLIRNR